MSGTRSASSSMSFCTYVRRHFFYPFDDASGFSSRATETSECIQSKSTRTSLYFVLCLEFFKTLCSVVRDIAIKWSRMAMTPNEAAKYKLYRGKIETFDLRPLTSTEYFVDSIKKILVEILLYVRKSPKNII